jgi:hypothetical protein
MNSSRAKSMPAVVADAGRFPFKANRRLSGALINIKA